MVTELVSRWSLANHSNSVFTRGARIAQPRWMLARGILGSGRTCGVSFRPFPNSSGWWWLISSVFLIRISCHKTTQANGYYDAWPELAVSITVLILTVTEERDLHPNSQEMSVQSPGWKDALDEEVETHSSILATRIPWTEEPDGLQSTES